MVKVGSLGLGALGARASDLGAYVLAAGSERPGASGLRKVGNPFPLIAQRVHAPNY